MCWKVGLVLYVVVKKTSRRGTLIAKKGTKWRFKPDGWRKTVSVCPIRFKWHYDLPLEPWSKKLSVILVQATLQPFKYQRETFGKWHGAKMARTGAFQLPVWQAPGSNKVFVGHLGAFRLVECKKGELVPLLAEPGKESFFVGRGTLKKTRFRCLKTACRQKAPRSKILELRKPLYKVTTRDELSVGF